MGFILLWGKDKFGVSFIRDFALVSDEDFEELNKIRWGLSDWGYAKNSSGISMHRKIMGCIKGDGVEVDHINGNKIDNQRANLRLVTRAQNAANVRSVSGTSSKYKGVTWSKKANVWQAQVGKNDKLYHLGRFTSDREAAIAYNIKAIELFGEFACLNVIPDEAEEIPQIQIEAQEKASAKEKVKADKAEAREKQRLEGQLEADKNSETGTASKYRGVTWVKRPGKWKASLEQGPKSHYLGMYVSETEAALAYDKKAFELLGGLAKLNFITEEFLIAQAEFESEVVAEAVAQTQIKATAYLIATEAKAEVKRKLMCQPVPKSQYRGVNYDKFKRKWSARVMVNRVLYNLGRFPTEIEAAYACYTKGVELGIGPASLYNFTKEDEERLLKTQTEVRVTAKSKTNVEEKTNKSGQSSKFVGVSFVKARGKWKSYLWINSKKYNIGTFLTEIEAALAYNKKIIELGIDPSKLNVIP